MEHDVRRFLTLIERQLEAASVVLEFGGSWTTEGGSRHLRVPINADWHLVVTFQEPPDDPDAIRAKLVAMARAFHGKLDEAQQTLPELADLSFRELDHALEVVRALADARCAVVLDSVSPVIWGASPRPSAFSDVDGALAVARGPGGPGAEIVMANAIASVRDAGVHPGHVAFRAFGGSYVLLVAYDAPFSEVAAEGTLIRALPVIERLVARLPPVEPGGGGKARDNVMTFTRKE